MLDHSHAVAFAAGLLSCALLLSFLRRKDKAVEEVAPSQSRTEKKLLKLQKAAQEVVPWGSNGEQMLGLLPRLWIEVLDTQHRYGALLYGYFSRWELSNTEDDFFQWLDNGPGRFIDLPKYPRRLLEESKILYLTRAQQQLFEVRITDGLFYWEWDDTLVCLPPKQGHEKTPRESFIEGLLLPRMLVGRRRDALLASARREVEAAIAAGEEATHERLEDIARPLIAEDLLCQLRDPWFSERLAADHKRRLSPHAAGNILGLTPVGRKKSTPVCWRTPKDFGQLRDVMPASYEDRGRLLREPMPLSLKAGVDWQAFLGAIDHDEGLRMDTPFPKASDRIGDDGIFVVDKFGVLHCSMKVRGVFQHSSFVRGHCVRVAGGITIEDGVLKRLSPHSGHYQPMLETFEEMQRQWGDKGVSFAGVEVKPFIKK